MAKSIDGELGPRTMRKIRNYLAADAERKIVAACLDSGHFDGIDEIHALLDHIKTGHTDQLLDDIERETNGQE